MEDTGQLINWLNGEPQHEAIVPIDGLQSPNSAALHQDGVDQGT
jgi:hypothetical protein